MTDEGTLIYKLPPRTFTFRCVVRQPADADDAAAVQRACDRAAADLANRGIRHSTLRGTATSLDDMKIRRPDTDRPLSHPLAVTARHQFRNVSWWQ
ncbi:DUF6204 family protein [Streptomyces sp. NBC_00055]|uniref:DUF6204 family protein n=1 Tax=Streptomyces sp. NBC_00055 TaxID=2975632 RepID=UPI00386E607B